MRNPPYLEDLIKNVESSCELSNDEEYVRRIVEIISYIKSRIHLFGSIDTVDSGSLYNICQGGSGKDNKLGKSIYLDIWSTYIREHGNAPFFADKSWYEVDKLLQITKDMIPDYVLAD